MIITLIILFTFVNINLLCEEKHIGQVDIDYSINNLNDNEFELFINFTIEDGWHIYWKNPGDSGIPTHFDFDIPKDVKIKKSYWSIPEIIPYDEFVSIGYTNKAYFKFHLQKNSHNAFEKFKCRISWLICKEGCYQMYDTLEIAPNNQPLINHFLSFFDNDELFPQDTIKASSAYINDNYLIFSIKNIDKNFYSAKFIPHQSGFLSLAQQKFRMSKKEIIILTPLDELRTKNPEYLSGLIIFKYNNSQKTNFIQFNIK